MCMDRARHEIAELTGRVDRGLDEQRKVSHDASRDGIHTTMCHDMCRDVDRGLD